VRVLLALTLPVAAVIAAGINPLVRAAFGFDAAGTTMLTWTVRIYLLSLTGYTIHEVITRSFYARKEAWFPFVGVVIRLTLFALTGLAALAFFSAKGAPAIAFTELSLTVETIVLFVLINTRLPERIRGGSSLLRGLLAAAVGGILTLALATYLPGGAVLTALIGMTVGGLLSLAIVWKDVRLLFKM
jgi:putative peptidoglycan lipid II flippase